MKVGSNPILTGVLLGIVVFTLAIVSASWPSGLADGVFFCAFLFVFLTLRYWKFRRSLKLWVPVVLLIAINALGLDLYINYVSEVSSRGYLLLGVVEVFFAVALIEYFLDRPRNGSSRSGHSV